MFNPSPKRILFATIGSLGDLHPCLALATELARRGHHVTIAASSYYRERVEPLGLHFSPIRPHFDPADTEFVRQCEDPRRGVEILFRDLVLPTLPATYEDLLPLAAQADLLVTGEIVYAGPLIYEKLASRNPPLHWASLILSPASFLSAYDPSVLSNVPGLLWFRRLGQPAYRALLNFGRLATRHWWQPVRALRRREGLRPSADPLFHDKFSPELNLALFSTALAHAQPDWPSNTLQPGFVFYEHAASRIPPPPQLEAFLAAGPPPLVFTLGSTATHNPGNFFPCSAAAAAQLNQRAVLIGPAATDLPATPTLLPLAYADYAHVFPHASVVIHQGGSGTTAQAMRAGKPMLIVPYNWDQPDNGARIERLNASLTIRRANYSTATAARALRQILTNPAFTLRAKEMAASLDREDSLNLTCNALESLFR